MYIPIIKGSLRLQSICTCICSLNSPHIWNNIDKTLGCLTLTDRTFIRVLTKSPSSHVVKLCAEEESGQNMDDWENDPEDHVSFSKHLQIQMTPSSWYDSCTFNFFSFCAVLNSPRPARRRRWLQPGRRRQCKHWHWCQGVSSGTASAYTAQQSCTWTMCLQWRMRTE